MENYKAKLKIVQTLALQGFEILEIVIGDEVYWYLVKEFEKASMGAIQNSPFFSLRGKDITDFILNYTMSADVNVLSNNLRQIDNREPNFRFEFSSNHHWRFYTTN